MIGRAEVESFCPPRAGAMGSSSPPVTTERLPLWPSVAFSMPPGVSFNGTILGTAFQSSSISRTQSTPGPEGHKLRMAALSIPEHESIGTLRTRSETSQALFRPFRKVHLSSGLSYVSCNAHQAFRWSMRPDTLSASSVVLTRGYW